MSLRCSIRGSKIARDSWLRSPHFSPNTRTWVLLLPVPTGRGRGHLLLLRAGTSHAYSGFEKKQGRPGKKMLEERTSRSLYVGRGRDTENVSLENKSSGSPALPLNCWVASRQSLICFSPITYKTYLHLPAYLWFIEIMDAIPKVPFVSLRDFPLPYV